MDGDARDAASGIAWVRVELSADRSTIGIGAADSAIGHIEARPDDAPIVGGIPEGPHWGSRKDVQHGPVHFADAALYQTVCPYPDNPAPRLKRKPGAL
jgi:hypothetical protein